MRVLVPLALVAAGATIAGIVAGPRPVAPGVRPGAGPRRAGDGDAAGTVPCPAGSLADAGVCTPAPPPGEAADRLGGARQWLPRRPDRPASLGSYRLPGEAAGAVTRPAGRPWALRLPMHAGDPVHQVGVDGQVGPATLVLARPGRLIVEASVDIGGRRRRVLTVLDGLTPTQGLKVGAPVPDGTLLGVAGPWLGVELYRRRADAPEGPPGDLAADVAIPTDARNALPQK